MSAGRARPFVKWAGGKTQLLSELLGRAPPSIETYFEPLVGGGALFFALADGPERAPRRAVLNDLSRELVTTYEVVRHDLRRLTERLGELQCRYLEAERDSRAEIFYAVREQDPDEPVEVAARLIFLNKTCFNGLYRVNRRGRFNVPHGRYSNPRILDGDTLTAASHALRDVELLCTGFETMVEAAKPGDFVYFDPPFHPLTETSRFTAYTKSGFGREDELRLKRCIDRLTAEGVAVMLSNSSHDFVLGMYLGGGYRVEELQVRRAINSRGDRRGGATELVITNYDLLESKAE